MGVLKGNINKCEVYHTDAYAIAVKNGFEGTIEEWLASLKGDDGEQGIQGEKGDKGDKGDPYVNITNVHQSTQSGGISVIEFSDGHTLSVFNGTNGAKGANGVGISSITQTMRSYADGGTNTMEVAKTDGTRAYFYVQNGTKGSTGADGKTPVKGLDYFTTADKADIVADVKASLTTETWTFTLESGATVTQRVYVG